MPVYYAHWNKKKYRDQTNSNILIKVGKNKT